VGYFVFAYDLVRTEYVKLLLLYASLFALFYFLIRYNKSNFWMLAGAAILFRLLFLFATPNLSQDFYRFIWDGRMILEGMSPYLYTPESFIGKNVFPIAQAKELFDGMGALNASHFSNYAPVNQLCFVLAGLFSGSSILGSILVFRIIIIAADVGILYFGKKLLEKFEISGYHIFWFILNPFVIIEFTGNLHFESLMIFFLVWSIYLLLQNRWKASAIVFSLAVSVKLIPLIFLPLFIQKLGWKKWMGFNAVVLVVTLLLFAPFFSQEFILNYAETVGLWFQNFEFNASLYYIAREIGYSFRGYNEIAIIGKYIAILTVIFVGMIAIFRKNKTTLQLIHAMLFVLTFYYFTATTVHPWYIATLLILAIFTRYKFPLIWTAVIVLSYLAYANTDNKENLWLIGLEYVLVYGVFIYEVFFKGKKKYA
jgi:hypothetical protein